MQRRKQKTITILPYEEALDRKQDIGTYKWLGVILIFAFFTVMCVAAWLVGALCRVWGV